MERNYVTATTQCVDGPRSGAGESLSGDVGAQRELFADVRALEAVEFAVVLDDRAARTQAVRRDVAQHVAVQPPVLPDTPPDQRADLTHSGRRARIMQCNVK